MPTFTSSTGGADSETRMVSPMPACSRMASAVLEATTTAVVQSIVGIIVATAIITIICNVLEV